MLVVALNDASVAYDPAGNEKFRKRRRGAVDDLAVAGVLSVAVGARAWARLRGLSLVEAGAYSTHVQAREALMIAGRGNHKRRYEIPRFFV